ncbi:SDR family NAD(P)-dependent oxidoreductase [Pseudomaricurvus sp. HS19]|uniref:SDR family NAD(P)-dependent oxidoreductase n=1 Tax=Pseudomaricurvus sp. HS19 TaxID=2692626 RepID=UPI00136C1D9E|nr:SDR family oxidoreductase [Pseudomaricurvus sp. HS19]MYM64178.1 SDR family oxidoreductase [Pseudomaricurvus sp. HS19]
MSKRLQGKVAVITGGGAGLGQTCAVLFAREGADLILTDINEAGLQESAELVRAAGAQCSVYAFDIADEAAVKAFGEEVCASHPKIDVLYNNAGIAYGEINKMINDVSKDRWLHFLAVNTVAPMLMAEALRPSLAAAKGLIINQSSMASYAPATVYGVTKAALNSITYGMANIYSADGIRCNAIAPGLMETPANKAALPPETHARIKGMQLIDLDGTATDIANLALFLASEEGRFINCDILSCDGGNRLRGWRG